MNCIVELRQIDKAEKNKSLHHPTFEVEPTIHYEVHYFPDNLYMNLRSHKPFNFYLHLENPNLCREVFTRFLFQTLIPQSQFDSILNAFSSKSTSIGSDPRNFGSNLIKLTLSIRVIWTQRINAEARKAWYTMLHSDGRCGGFSARLPATNESIRELKRGIYTNDDGDSGSECSICLKTFNVKEKITRMPCFHYYHVDCIVKWLRNSHLCPICRFPLPVCRVVESAFPFTKRTPAKTTTTFCFADDITFCFSA